MGIIYSKSESKKFIEDIQKNLKSGLEVTTDLTAGSHNIIQSIDGKTLSGAAYTAGKNLFSELIIPTVSRCHQALQEVETDLSTYISANNTIQEASQDTLDEEKLESKIHESEMYRNTVSATASALSNQAFDLLAMTNPVTAVVSLANHLFDVQGKLNRYVESLDQDIEKLKKDLRLLQNFGSQVQGLFNNSLNNFKIAMQSVLVLNNTKVNSDGTYTLPAGIDGSWFTEKKSDNQIIDHLKNETGVSIPPEIEKIIADYEKELAQNPELLKIMLETWKNLKGKIEESVLLTGLVSVAQEMINTKITDEIVDTFSDSLFMYLRNNTTAFLDRGLVAITNTGANFVVKETPNAFKQLVRFGATKGLPIIGGLFDFGLMKAQGEDTGDAAVKATAHTAISMGSGIAGAAVGEKAGAFLGAAIGTIIPGAGTAVGAVAGGVIGAAVGFVGGVVGSMAFDWFWDNKEEISKDISKTFNDVKENGKQVISNIIDSAKGFIDGLNNLGSVYG